MIDSLTPWSLVAVLLVFLTGILSCITVSAFFLYRALLQVLAENRRLTERLVTFSSNSLAAQSASDSLASKDPLKQATFQPGMDPETQAAFQSLVSG